MSCVIFLALKHVGDVGWVHAIGLTVLLGLLPTTAVAQVPLAREMDLPRRQAYASSAATLVLLAVVSLGLSRVGGVAGLGFVVLPPAAFLAWTLGLVVAGLLVTLAFRWISMALGLGEDPILRALIPETPGERRAFVGLSVAAGFGEEMAYRGYVLALLLPLLGAWGAVAVSSLVFGVLHAYQGVLGMVRTAVIGTLMAAGFLASGSLWPPVAAHVVFDILAGVFLAGYLMVPEADGGVVD